MVISMFHFFNTLKLFECSVCVNIKSKSVIYFSLCILYDKLKNKMARDLNYAKLIISNNDLVATLVINTLFL